MVTSDKFVSLHQLVKNLPFLYYLHSIDLSGDCLPEESYWRGFLLGPGVLPSPVLLVGLNLTLTVYKLYWTNDMRTFHLVSRFNFYGGISYIEGLKKVILEKRDINCFR